LLFSIIAIQREEAKVKLSLKDAAKKNQIDVCKILAKEVVQSRKAVNKLYASKAQINSVMMSMDQQLCEYIISPGAYVPCCIIVTVGIS